MGLSAGLRLLRSSFLSLSLSLSFTNDGLAMFGHGACVPSDSFFVGIHFAWTGGS